MPVEDGPSTNTFSSQSSHHSTDSLDSAEASKMLTLVESFLFSRFIHIKSPSLTLYWMEKTQLLSNLLEMGKVCAFNSHLCTLTKKQLFHAHNQPHAGSNNTSK